MARTPSKANREDTDPAKVAEPDHIHSDAANGGAHAEPSGDSDSKGDPDAYAVGYARPPLHSRFKRGQSGNPKGREKQSRNMRTVLQQVLNEDVQIRGGGRVRRMPAFEALVRTTLSRAFKGESKMRLDLEGLQVNLAQIRVFLAVVEHGSVTAAAAHLNVSQPAVTKRIRELERALGAPLIERSGRGIVTTRFGDVFLRHSRAAIAEITRASEAIMELRSAAEPAVQVGALPNAAYGLVPMAVRKLLEKNPHAIVSIVEGTLEPLIAALRQGKLDMVVGALMNDDPGPDLAVETLFHDQLYIAARRGHPLAKRAGLKLGDVRTALWILPPRDVNAHRQWRNAFIFAGMEPPRHSVETASLAAARALLLSSNGVALLAQQVVELEKRLGLLIVLPIELPSTARAIGITRRAGSSLSETARELLAIIRDVAVQYATPQRRRKPRMPLKRQRRPKRRAQ